MASAESRERAVSTSSAARIDSRPFSEPTMGTSNLASGFGATA